MDYSNIEEVAKAIMGYDRNLGMTFYNLPTVIDDAFTRDSGLKESKYYDARNQLNELALKCAIKTLLVLKRNKRDLVSEKVDDLFRKYHAVSEDNRDEKVAAYEAYSEAEDSQSDASHEVEELEWYIVAQELKQFAH